MLTRDKLTIDPAPSKQEMARRLNEAYRRHQGRTHYIHRSNEGEDIAAMAAALSELRLVDDQAG
jgi:hypothetical protein